MISTLFQNGQRVIVQVLDWAQTSWQSVFANRSNDYSQAGVCKNFLSEFAITTGSNNVPAFPSINIGSGVAYDTSSNRIFISSTDTTPYNVNNPNQTSNDGTGHLIPTPQSTGCINVPLTTNSFNYVWIEYLQTVDTSQFTLQDVTLAKQWYKGLDGYVIVITTVNLAPSATAVFLGSINLTGSGLVSPTTISQSGRTNSANYPYRTLTETPLVNLTDRTTSYALGGTYFVDDHVKAVGSGTVTPTNPHGMAPIDIGIAGASSLEFHQEFLHSPGIVGSASSVTSSLHGSINSIIPGFDQFIIQPLAINEVVTGATGVSLTSANFPTQTIFQFSATDAPGTWYFYVDFVNIIVARTQTNLISSPNPNFYVLYSALYTFPDPNISNGHLSAVVDYRVFGNIATRELQDGAVTGPKINPSALSVALSKDGSNNIQVNVDGTTIVVNGFNELQAVVGGAAPNGGLSETGGDLSVNVDNSTIDINGSNQVEVKAGGITNTQLGSNSVQGGNIAPNAVGTSQLSSSVAGNGLSGGSGSPLSVNADGSTIIISSDTLSVGSIGSGQLADGAASYRRNAGISISTFVPSGLTQIFSNGFTVPSTSQTPIAMYFGSVNWSGGNGTAHMSFLVNGTTITTSANGGSGTLSIPCQLFPISSGSNSFSLNAAGGGSGANMSFSGSIYFVAIYR